MTVPVGMCRVTAFYDLTNNTMGWAGVQNQPNRWMVRNDNHPWEQLTNGQQKKYRYQINGQIVDLDLFNPYEENGLTGDYMLVSFGY